MKRKITVLLMTAILVLSLVPMSAVAAEVPSDTEISPQTIGRCTYGFELISSTTGRVTLSATSSGETPFIKTVVTLQYAPAGTMLFSNVPNVSPQTYNVYNVISMMRTFDFPISSSTREYRAIIEITDKVGGIENTSTYYAYLQR